MTGSEHRYNPDVDVVASCFRLVAERPSTADIPRVGIVRLSDCVDIALDWHEMDGIATRESLRSSANRSEIEEARSTVEARVQRVRSQSINT
jgi:hypothetical protein